MEAVAQVPDISNKRLWIGRVVSAIPVLMLSMSAVMKFAKPPEVIEGMGKLGWNESLSLPLGILELAVTIVYIIPRTAVLGAILVTAYLGGATATHVRVADPFWGPVLVGVLAWIGLYLREPRLASLVPLRSPRS